MLRRLSIIAIALTAAILTALAAPQSDTKPLTPEAKLRTAQQIIENFYVDSIDASHLTEEAIIAMLKSLDPHSTYTNAEETRALTEPLSGNFSGIGVRFQMLRDTVYVLEVTPGGPSDKIGILPGDRILSCNDTVVSGVEKKNSEILEALRGPKGTTALLKVKRGRTPKILTFKAKRDAIPINSVDFAYMLNDSVGLISLARFAETSTDEFNDALDRLRKKGMQHLIIDLKDNGGGMLRQATEIANIFLHRGDTLVSTSASKGKPTFYRAFSDGTFQDGRLVIMVNPYSASASEILAGAISDNDRGVIVGQRTYGKGLVQRPFPFPDGSMMRLTVSRYHTPSGRCIQKPYTSGDADSYTRSFRERLASAEMTSADSIQINDSTVYYTLRLHRPVYGGGGIVPDAFVPVDTSYYTPYYRDLVAKGVITSFATSYLDRNRQRLSRQYHSEKEYMDKVDPTIDHPLIEGLIKEAAAEGIEFNQEEFDTSSRQISLIMKGLIGRDLFSTETYYKIINPLNPTFVKALEIINSPELYESYLSGGPTPK